MSRTEYARRDSGGDPPPMDIPGPSAAPAGPAALEATAQSMAGTVGDLWNRLASVSSELDSVTGKVGHHVTPVRRYPHRHRSHADGQRQHR